MLDTKITCALAILMCAITICAVVVLARYFMKLTIKRCPSKARMDGKVIIITGANQGIGYHTAKELASRGGRVIIACRCKERGLAAKDRILAEVGPNAQVIYKPLDLSSLNSVRDFVQDFKATEQRLDVLINNAGVTGLGDRYTNDGIVEGMQINYFAPFLLTLLLLPLLRESSGRIINVASLLHYRGEVKLNFINKAGHYRDIETYCNSKLCIILFTKELSRRLCSSNAGVTVNALHPGVVKTNIVRENVAWFTRVSFDLWCWFCCRTPEEGAQSSIFLAVAQECAGVSGKYYVDCAPAFTWYNAWSQKLANDLFKFSEELVGETMVTPFNKHCVVTHV